MITPPESGLKVGGIGLDGRGHIGSINLCIIYDWPRNAHQGLNVPQTNVRLSGI